MPKKLFGLFCFLLISSHAQASEFYTEQFTLSNKTPYLKITVPPKNIEMIASGPSDATVIDNTFVILDTWNSGLAFFDKQGNFLKRIPLPTNAHFERVVRDEDNSLFVLGAFENINSNQTMVVHIQNGVITEKTILPISEYRIENIIPDDYGLFMERTEEHLDRQKLSEASDDDLDQVMDKMIVHIEDRISRTCISCEPKSADGISSNKLLYRSK